MKSSKQLLDRHQLRTLLKTTLKLGWRGGTHPFSAMSTKKKSKFPGMLIIILFNFFFSILFSIMMAKIPDFFTALVVTSILPFVLVSIQVLLEFSTIIVSPDDYDIIAPQPVSSKTYYISKLLYLLTYVSILTAAFALLPAIIASIFQKTPLAGVVVILHYWIANIFGAVFVMNIFTLALKTVERRKVHNFMAYVQFGLMLLFYLGMNVMPRMMESIISSIDLGKIPFLKAMPPYWFGCWVKLITHGWDTATFGYAVLGVILLVVLGRFAVSYLSLSYSESLSRAIVSKKEKHRKELSPFLKKIWLKITTYESRAIFRLIVSQFKNDMTFRLGMLGLLPMFILIALVAIREGYIMKDPFLDIASQNHMLSFLIAMPISMLPYVIHYNVQYSKSWHASWVYYATPVDRLKLILAAKHLIIIMFFIPIGVILAITVTLLLDNVLHGILHAIFLINLCLLGLTIVNCISSRLPFSFEKSEGSNALNNMFVITSCLVLIGVPVGLISSVGYGGYFGWALIVAGTCLINLLMTKVQNNRIMDQVRNWEFMG
jgi:ABC-2 type transport system permease protein